MIIDTPKGLYYSVIDGHSDDCTKSLADVFKNATSLDNATNGDIIKALFPSLTIKKQDEDVNLFIGEPILKNVLASIDDVLWNAPYKAESEDEE